MEAIILMELKGLKWCIRCCLQWQLWGLHFGCQWGDHNCSWSARTYIATV